MIRKCLKELSYQIAHDSITKATEILNLKTDNLAIYGKEYKNTIEYAGLELKEQLYYTKFKFFKGVFDWLGK